ncbi:MAG: nitroreductase family protein [Paludibacteraceae bacterium]|nr:nitroreductase family protein [Paludibacteraceae bacterium]
MNTFLQLALQRRSIRKYEDKPVEQDKVQTILQAALASPSSKHLNPWEFVVITDRDVLTRLSACRTYGSQLLQGSPLGIAVCVDADATDTWQCDGAIAALNMLLCAEDLGLGGCWVQVHGRGVKAADGPDGEDIPAEVLVRRLLSIPEKLTVLCIVSIGYKAEEKRSINPEKLQYEKIHYGKY